MNTFLRRLKYYGIGFGIGAIMVMFILPNRSCSWTPSNRVKNMILARFIVANDREWQRMGDLQLKASDVVSVLNDGTLNFKMSKKDGSTKIYAIDKKFPTKKTIRFYFTLPDESFISEVHLGETPAHQIKNTNNGYGHFLSFPNDEYIIYPDSTEAIRCQMEQLNIKTVREIYADIKKSGRLNFQQTHWDKDPKPSHQIDYIRQQDTVSIQATWYKNKVFVSDIHSPHTSSGH